jgi:hypothetical protein
MFRLLALLVRNLGIFMLNLIQKIYSELVTTCLCTWVILLLAPVADMDMNDIQIIAEKILNLRNSRIELYLAEGPMLEAPAAPRALVDIVRCSMSRTTVDAGWCSQCNPLNVHVLYVFFPREQEKQFSFYAATNEDEEPGVRRDSGHYSASVTNNLWNRQFNCPLLVTETQRPHDPLIYNGHHALDTHQDISNISGIKDHACYTQH